MLLEICKSMATVYNSYVSGGGTGREREREREFHSLEMVCIQKVMIFSELLTELGFKDAKPVLINSFALNQP